MSKEQIMDALEAARCADINLNNAKKTGNPVFVQIAQEQVRSTIKHLEEIEG
jgi:hypothetical protein